MANPLAQAQRSALRMNADIGSLFAQAGTSEHPRGFVLTAYRNAKRAMKQALKETDPLLAARDVFQDLRANIRSQSLSLFMDAQALGMEESARQLRFYDIHSAPGFNSGDRVTAAAMLDAVLAKVDAQELTTRALLMTGAEDEQIVGSENRAGVLRSSDILPSVIGLATTLVWTAFAGWTASHSTLQFNKQAIAALGNRTTECCLRVHSQIVKIDRPFHLTGSPAFADYMDWSPFHHHCRTSIALHLSAYDDGLTAQMQESADWFLNERRQGRNPDRHPANAFA